MLIEHGVALTMPPFYHAARVQACDVIDRELVEVRDIVDQAGGDHLVDDLVA